MAHSGTPNGGLKYAHARDHGVEGKELEELKRAVGNRKRTPDQRAESSAVIMERIHAVNKQHKQSDGRYR